MICVVVIEENEGMDSWHAEWLTTHVTNGAGVDAEDPIAALRKLADELERSEEFRAGIPE